MRTRLPPLLPLCLLSFACAGARREDPLERAPRPEPARLAQDVRWLSDDAREGRRAGSAGEADAARWLAQRLEALGLEPAGSAGFLQPFEVALPPRDGGGSSVEVRSADMRIASEASPAEARALVPLFCSSAAEVEGPLVFAGYGIVDPERGRDDYAGRSVEGAIVLLVRGTPPDGLLASAPAGEAAPVETPHGPATPSARGWGSGGAILQKVSEAKHRGARAVIVAQHPGRDEPMLTFETGSGVQAHVPALHASAELAEELVPGYAECVRRLDAGEDPAQVGASLAGPERAARVVADVVRAHGTAQNVLGRLRGVDSRSVLLIGAHFDHLGRGGPGSLAPAEQGEIHNGADDNASGTAAVLELARCLAAGPRLPYDVVFALWSGEELGLLGSEHWIRHPTVALESVRANLNLDMVGRGESGKLAVLGAGSSTPFAVLLAEASARAGLSADVSLSGQGVGGSDHQTFLQHEIPALHFFTGLHADYHRPSDDYERFEAAGAARIVALVLDLVGGIERAGTLAFVAPPKEAGSNLTGGFRTRLGLQLDYGYGGPGVRLNAPSPGGPAEKAGLTGGDCIVGFGAIRIEGMDDYMYALNAHKPGDVVQLRYLRNGAEESVQVTLEASQSPVQ